MVIKYIHYQTRDDKDKYFYNRPDGIDEYVLILAHTPAYFCSDGVKYLLKKYQMFIYGKRQPQLFYSAGVDFIHDWFHFDMTAEEDRVFHEYGIPFGRPISLPNPYIYSDYIRILSYEYNQTHPHTADIIAKQMDCFFMQLSDMLRAAEGTENPYADHIHFRPLNKIRMDISSFPYRDWTLEVAAETSNMSKSWFQHHYRLFFGTSFQENLIQSRVDYAKKMLLQNDDKIECIAQMCGYNNVVHFMRQFKMTTGFTPTFYRRQFR